MSTRVKRSEIVKSSMSMTTEALLLLLTCVGAIMIAYFDCFQW